jgi:hypothetical protein
MLAEFGFSTIEHAQVCAEAVKHEFPIKADFLLSCVVFKAGQPGIVAGSVDIEDEG